MFSKEYLREIQEGFDRQMSLLPESKRDEIRDVMERGLADAVEVPPRVRSAAGRVCHLENADALADDLEVPPRVRSAAGRVCHLENASALADAVQALIFLYSAMPLSDALDYPAALFYAFAQHGAWLYSHGPYAGKVPERLFANYVLHHRINNEDIVDNRGFFYDRLKEEIAGKSMYDAAVETNYWCAAQATYHASDGRTENPLTMYRTGDGRCGEESTFGVSVLRSIGIPARQVYAPLWSHCDDNHAWVEVWCENQWYFLGACEPEERLNFGWFTGPASRAMLIHSRWFGCDEPLDPVVGKKGMARVLNHLPRYADTTELAVRIEDAAGNPVPGAHVRFHVLNHGEFGLVADLVSEGESTADASSAGLVHLTTGYGDLYVTAEKDGYFGEKMISLVDGNAGGYTITLQKTPACDDIWHDIEFHAPALGFLNDNVLTDVQKAKSAARLTRANLHREARMRETWQEREVHRALARFSEEDAKELEIILQKAKGNLGELIRFLEWDASGLAPAEWGSGSAAEHWKLLFLKALREKDYRDVTAEVLIDCCGSALPYAESVMKAVRDHKTSHDEVPGAIEKRFAIGDEAETIFYRYLMNPRVENEMLRPCRRMLENVFQKEKKLFTEEPWRLVPSVRSFLKSLPEEEYERLVTSPAGCLRGGIASRLSIDVFCVTLYRTLGIPARLSMLDHSLQYYWNGVFVSANADGIPDGKTAEAAACVLRLVGDHTLRLSNWERYSVEKFEAEGDFRRLFLWGTPINEEKNELAIEGKPGIYRVLTTNRLPDGNQIARQITFNLAAGEERTLVLSLRTPSLSEILVNRPVEELYFQTRDGERRALSELTADLKETAAGKTQGVSAKEAAKKTPCAAAQRTAKALLLWLEVSREPTEHILNEMYDRRDAFAALNCPLYVVLGGPEDLADPTLSRTMEALPCLTPVYGESKDDLRLFAREVSQEAENLPLTAVLQTDLESPLNRKSPAGLTCIYSDSGYNVGLADILLRILQEA